MRRIVSIDEEKCDGCGVCSLTRIAKAAIERAGVDIPAKDVPIGIQGGVLDDEALQDI